MGVIVCECNDIHGHLNGFYNHGNHYVSRSLVESSFNQKWEADVDWSLVNSPTILISYSC